MVVIVTPLRGQPVTPVGPGLNDSVIVDVGLGDEQDLPTGDLGQGIHSFRQLGQDVLITCVNGFVHGIEARPVDVVIAQPHQGVVEDVLPYLARVRAIDVDARAPCVPYGAQVGFESGQVVSAGSEVVVDDVLDDGEALRMARVDESLIPVRAAVEFVHCEPENTVVAPVVCSVEHIDGHQLDEIHTDAHQMIEALNRGVEGSVQGEGPDVKFIAEPAAQRFSAPTGTSPRATRTTYSAGGAVDIVGLAPGSWVGGQFI